MKMKNKIRFTSILTALYISGWLDSMCKRFTDVTVDEVMQALTTRSNFTFVSTLTNDEIELFIYEEIYYLHKSKNKIIL